MTTDDDALALIDELLRPWNTGSEVHPGRRAIAAPYEDVAQVEAWNARRAALAARTATPKETP